MTADRDDRFMRRALELARRGLGQTAPNPPVGCVLTHGDRIVSEGWHRKAGGPHAEVDALSQLDGKYDDLTAYVTLEPCNHSGRTGPCTEALMQAGVRRVVVGCPDLNPRVNGTGMERLRQAGIAVELSSLQAECTELIRAFSHWITTGKPLVTLKIATSLDGRIATATGHSQWVTGELSRRQVHKMRHETDALMVGGSTVRADNPRLTTRLQDCEGHNPLRVVVSASLDLPSDAIILSEDYRSETWVFTGVDSSKANDLESLGIRTQVVGGDGESVDLTHVIQALGQAEVTALLVEGGQRLATALLKAQLVDRICVFLAPKVVGGDGLGWTGPLGLLSMNHAITLSDITVSSFGDDVCIEGNCVYGNH